IPLFLLPVMDRLFPQAGSYSFPSVNSVQNFLPERRFSPSPAIHNFGYVHDNKYHTARQTLPSGESQSLPSASIVPAFQTVLHLSSNPSSRNPVHVPGIPRFPEQHLLRPAV